MSWRIPTWSRNSSPMVLAFSREIPDTSANRKGSRSMTNRVSSPNCSTIRAAIRGPIPLMTRLER